MIKAIPTLHNGVQYRSRLEARWGAFFNLIGWRTEYEPCDFNGWIPDFAIFGDNVVYVEVKPVDSFPEDVADEIDRSGCENECLIVGLTPTQKWKWNDSVLRLGWLRQGGPPLDHECCGCWADAVIGSWDSNPNGFGFCHSEQSYTDRITGKYDGGAFGSAHFDAAKFTSIWRKACNEVQWKKPV